MKDVDAAKRRGAKLTDQEIYGITKTKIADIKKTEDGTVIHQVKPSLISPPGANEQINRAIVAYLDNANQIMQDILKGKKQATPDEYTQLVYKLGCGQVPDFDRAIYALEQGIKYSNQLKQLNVPLASDILQQAINLDPRISYPEKIYFLQKIKKHTHGNVIKSNDLDNKIFKMLSTIDKKQPHAQYRIKFPSKTGTSLYIPMDWKST